MDRKFLVDRALQLKSNPDLNWFCHLPVHNKFSVLSLSLNGDHCCLPTQNPLISTTFSILSELTFLLCSHPLPQMDMCFKESWPLPQLQGWSWISLGHVLWGGMINLFFLCIKHAVHKKCTVISVALKFHEG